MSSDNKECECECECDNKQEEEKDEYMIKYGKYKIGGKCDNMDKEKLVELNESFLECIKDIENSDEEIEDEEGGMIFH